jgi:hypothetical protein
VLKRLEAAGKGRQRSRRMRPYSTQEKFKITAGAIAAIVIVGMMVVVALAIVWMPPLS